MTELATRVYCLLLIAYPRDFRREYGAHMVQAFRTASAHCAQSTSVSDLVIFWARTLFDLVRSAALERVEARDSQRQFQNHYPIAVAIAISAFTGMLQLWIDADTFSAMLLLGGTYLCGALSAHRPWRWALLAGVGIPCAWFVGHHVGTSIDRHHEFEFAFLSPLMLAYVGAYMGAFTGRHLPGLLHTPRGDTGAPS